MENQITMFKVDSTRIHDIELPAGTTVGQLRATLFEGGYDVNEALCTVNRAAEGDRMIGRNDGYILKKGDTVEFSTRDIELPATRRKLQAAAEAAAQKAKAAMAAQMEQARCRDCGKCAPKQEGDTVKIAGGRIEVKATPNGVVIIVR